MLAFQTGHTRRVTEDKCLLHQTHLQSQPLEIKAGGSCVRLRLDCSLPRSCLSQNKNKPPKKMAESNVFLAPNALTPKSHGQEDTLVQVLPKPGLRSETSLQ